MKTAGVSELKSLLSKYLMKVKAGEEVLVTDRGRPIAKIVPITKTEMDSDARLQALERAGLARIGTGALKSGFWKLPRPKDRKGLALQNLLSERKEGR